MSADKTLSWSYTEDFTAEDEATAQARIRGLELGITPVSSGTGAALRMLAASVGAKSVAEVGTGTGVSGLWLLSGMGTDGVLTTIDVEPELQREARRAFDGAGYPSSRTRIIQGRASDVMPRMAARSYDMVVLDVAPEEAILLASNALRMLRRGGVLAVTRALWNDHVADPARRDVTTVAARELGKALRASRALLTTLLTLPHRLDNLATNSSTPRIKWYRLSPGRLDRSDLGVGQGLSKCLDLIGRDLENESTAALKRNPHDDGAAFLDDFERAVSGPGLHGSHVLTFRQCCAGTSPRDLSYSTTFKVQRSRMRPR